MRKTSHDGGDTTSITSGIENEIKKSGALIKSKKNSIKRKVQSFSHDSDDTVVEPLLQKDKEKSETSNQSTKYNLLPKSKTDSSNKTGSDKDRLIQDHEKQNSLSTSEGTDPILPMKSVKSNMFIKPTIASAPLHNHMNTNVFNSHNMLQGLGTTKSQVLVEIDTTKPVTYSSSPLIFTTAKIHTDGTTRQMEPVQVTPVPILSTIEVSIIKGLNTSNNGEVAGRINSNITSVATNVPKSKAIANTENKFIISTPAPNNKIEFQVKDSIMSQSSSTIVKNTPIISISNEQITLVAQKNTSNPNVMHCSNEKENNIVKDNIKMTDKDIIFRYPEKQMDLNKNPVKNTSNLQDSLLAKNPTYVTAYNSFKCPEQNESKECCTSKILLNQKPEEKFKLNIDLTEKPAINTKSLTSETSSGNEIKTAQDSKLSRPTVTKSLMLTDSIISTSSIIKPLTTTSSKCSVTQITTIPSPNRFGSKVVADISSSPSTSSFTTKTSVNSPGLTGDVKSASNTNKAINFKNTDTSNTSIASPTTNLAEVYARASNSVTETTSIKCIMKPVKSATITTNIVPISTSTMISTAQAKSNVEPSLKVSTTVKTSKLNDFNKGS